MRRYMPGDLDGGTGDTRGAHATAVPGERRDGGPAVMPGQPPAWELRRTTFRHRLIVDPCGSVLAEGGDAAGVIHADLTLPMPIARAAIPSLGQDRTLRVRDGRGGTLDPS